MPLFHKGIVLAQHKEPAFSKPIVSFISQPSESLPESAADADADALIAIAKAAAIIDERDGIYLYQKLLRAKQHAVAILADAVDDEPYVSSQIAPLLQLSGEVGGGLALCAQIAAAKQVQIAVYKNISDLQTKIPAVIEGYPVIKLRGGYPAESRLEQCTADTDAKLIVGVGALIHFYRAVTLHVKQTTTFITVSGDCVASPMNMEVSIGTTVDQLLERCGLIQEPTRMVSGGSMTGIAILDTEKTVVTPTTRAILAFHDNTKKSDHVCIGCGRCAEFCPQQLNPMYILRFAKTGYFAYLRPFDTHLCIGCGTCSYVCPAKLEIAKTVRLAQDYANKHFGVSTPAPEEEDTIETENK